jgi:predicted HAD superfamily Cof-like phosphohydrolase
MPDTPELLDSATRVLRAKLVLTEALEFCRALGVSVADINVPVDSDQLISELQDNQLSFSADEGEMDMVETMDAICDLHYVVTGTEVAMGVDGDLCFSEVHRTNMEKSAEKDEHGKTIKPEGWKPPDLKEVLTTQYPNKAAIF